MSSLVNRRWKTERLKYNSYIKGRVGWQNLRSDEFTLEGPYLVTGMHFKDDSVDWGSCYHVSTVRYAMAPEIQLRDDDLLITKDGTIGKLAHVQRLPGPACLNSHLLVIRPLRNAYSPRFLFYLLSSAAFEEFVLQRQSGTTFYGLTQEAIQNFPATLPPLDEQREIADFLDRETGRIDELAAKKKTLLALVSEKRRAAIFQVATKGLDTNASMKPCPNTLIGQVPAHWEIRRVGSFARVGNGSTPSREKREYWQDGTYPWLSSTVVNEEEVTRAEEFVTGVALRECHLPRVPAPAVLIGITGQGRTRGMASILRFEATINQHLVYVVPYRSEVDVEFLRRSFDAFYELLRMDSEGAGSTKGAITCEQIKQMRIPLPPLEEQLNIVKCLGEELARYDSLMSKTDFSIGQLHEYRSALISAAVTGQIDVRNYRPQEAAVLCQ
jgi:type I restriction enzyme S subunit